MTQGFSLRFPNEKVATLVMTEKYAAAEKELGNMPEQTNMLLLAWLKLKQQQKKDALELLDKHISQPNAENERTNRILAAIAVLFDTGHSQEAKLMEEKYLPEIKKNNNLLAKKIVFDKLRQQNDIPAALKVFDELLLISYKQEEQENAKNILYNCIMQLYSLVDPKLALDYLDKFMTKFPETKIDPGYIMQRANILATMGESLESLKTLDKIQSDFPDYYEGKSNKIRFFFVRGMNYDKLGEYDTAKKILQEGKKMCETDKKHLGMIGQFDAILQRYADEEMIKKTQEETNRRAMTNEIEPLPLPNYYRYIVLVIGNGIIILILILRWRYSCKKK
jgi:tetratricopeptide (TPR) repeat protein